MMAERLAEIRQACDTMPWGALPMVRELLDYIDGLKFANGVLDDAAKDAQAWSVRAQTAEAKCAQLEAHKAESMQVFASLQIQAIAKEIGAPLGSGAPEQILPWIKATKAQLEAQADESSATMERLSGVVERYRGGVLPSSAERCALRWSHSSATDRGSFDRGWEAREAEGIEAQRGGSDLAELIRRRYPRMLERGNPLYDAVLADGMVGVDREECDLLGHLHMVAMQFVMDADPAQRRSAAHLVQAVAALRQYAGRSAKVEVEG